MATTPEQLDLLTETVSDLVEVVTVTRELIESVAPASQAAVDAAEDVAQGLATYEADAFPKANQASAEAGTGEGLMTAVRTKQHYDARISSKIEAEAGALNDKGMTPLRTKQSIAAEAGVTIASQSDLDAAEASIPVIALDRINAKVGKRRDYSSFRGDLTHTLVPDLGLMPSFARTALSGGVLVSHMRDHLGNLQLCENGEARFAGARRVHNLIAASEDITASGIWSVGGTTTRTYLPWRKGRSGRSTVHQLVRASGTTSMLTLNSAVYRPGKHTFSIYLEGDGATPVRLSIVESTTPTELGYVVVTPPKRLTRYSVTAIIPDATNHRVEIKCNNSGAGTLIVDMSAQMERTSGAGDAPNDYVSRGVAGMAWPYHGSGVDGVRYFDTYNPYTLDAGLALRGPDILIERHKLKCLMTEPYALQGIYSSTAFEATQWTKTGLGATVVSGDTAYGVGYLRDVVEDSATSDHSMTQVWRAGSLPSNNTILSASILVIPAGRSWVWLSITNKAGSVCRVWFNLATGAVGTVSGGTNVWTHIWSEGDMWRIGLSCSSGTGASAPIYGFGLANADNVTSYAGDGVSGVRAGFAQFESNDHPTSIIRETPSATLYQRNYDDARINVHEAFTEDNWSVTCAVTPYYPTAMTNKSGWYLVWAVHLSDTQRFVTSIRPGIYGGTISDDRANDINGDMYIDHGDEFWDGVNDINFSRHYGETYHLSYGALPTAQTGNSNLVGVVDTNIMTNSIIGEMNVINVLTYEPTEIVLGALTNTGVTTQPRHSQSIGYIDIGYGKTAAEMVDRHKATIARS